MSWVLIKLLYLKSGCLFEAQAYSISPFKANSKFILQQENELYVKHEDIHIVTMNLKKGNYN